MYIIIPIIAIIALWILFSYNGLISSRNKVDYAYSSIDVMLKKRHDLIPNLVKAAKQYMGYESDILTKITALRTQSMDTNLSKEEKFALENKLSNAIGKMNITVENYPDLKANQSFLQLQAALNEVEEQISAARRTFNGAVMHYNNSVEMFPNSLIAQRTGHESIASFEATQTERENVDVGELFE